MGYEIRTLRQKYGGFERELRSLKFNRLRERKRERENCFPLEKIRKRTSKRDNHACIILLRDARVRRFLRRNRSAGEFIRAYARQAPHDSAPWLIIINARRALYDLIAHSGPEVIRGHGPRWVPPPPLIYGVTPLRIRYVVTVCIRARVAPALLPPPRPFVPLRT